MTDERRDIEALAEEATEIGQLRRELRTERARSEQLARQVAELRSALDLADAVQHADPTAPTWTRRKGKGKNKAIGVLLVTDTHFDELVRPEEVQGLNAYDRDIAYGRLERAFRNAVTVSKEYAGRIDYDGFVVLFGGDILSGSIHAELRESNVATDPETIVHWLEPMEAGLRLLAAEFPKLHVVGVVGNHGRRQKKPRYKRRAKDNLDWLFYQMLARQFAADDEVTFQVPDSLWALVELYDTTLLVEHGDEFKGGSGIAGAMSPLLLGEHRRRKQHDFDVLVTGHFHNRFIKEGLITGGCLKGPDEYSMGRGFAPSEASQELFLVSPEHGVTFNAPIFVTDRAADGW